MKQSNPKQSALCYSVFKTASTVFSKFKFRPEILRNEIKDKEGPFVIISNHAAALDFVNLISATNQRLNFVISNAFYRTIPLKGIMPRLGLIPKQQFQTSLSDIRNMKKVIDEGKILVLYPAGLMSDDGTQTPLPEATYKFLKWLGTDVYMAKNIGTYFAMPKWRKNGIRNPKTYIDIYKLFDKEELANADIDTVKQKTDEALNFDAYREQEEYLISHPDNANIEGLENVLYICPHCKKEFTMKVKDTNKIYCEECGYEEEADEYQFLHKTSEHGEEIRYASDWSRMISSIVREKIESGEEDSLSSEVEIHMIPNGGSKFMRVGSGTLTLTQSKIELVGTVRDKERTVSIPTTSFASLPYKPGENIDIQHCNATYRCFPKDGRITAKYINMIKIFHEMEVSAAKK